MFIVNLKNLNIPPWIAMKLNYFKRKEERNVYKNHFVRSYEIEKEDLSV